MARVKNAHAFAFVCKDDRPLAIHCSVPEKFWLALLKAADRMDIAADERFKQRAGRRENYEALEQTLAPTFRAKTRDEWLKILEAHDVPAVPLYNVAEVLDDPQVKHLGLIEDARTSPSRSAQFVGGPVRYDNLSKTKSAPPPLVGQHSRKILQELGYEIEQINALHSEGIIQTAFLAAVRLRNGGAFSSRAMKQIFSIAALIFFLATALQNSTAAEPANATAPEIFKQFSANVIKIEVVETGSAAKASVGTGFFANELGHIITNYHVVSKLIHSPDRYRIEVTDQSGQTDQATVLGVDVVYDLAVLRGSRPAKGFLRLESKPVEQGTRLYSLGHPRDLGLTIVEGTYNGLLKHTLYPKVHFTGSLNPGMSGGPTLTHAGSVVGVNVATEGEQISFLVPAERAVALLQRTAKGGSPPTGGFLAEVGRQIDANQKRYLADMFAKTTPSVVLGPLFVTDQAGGFFSLLGRRATAQGPSLRCRLPTIAPRTIIFSFQASNHRASCASIINCFDRGAQSCAILHSLFRSSPGRQRRDVWQRRGGDAVSLSDSQCANAHRKTQSGAVRASIRQAAGTLRRRVPRSDAGREKRRLGDDLESFGRKFR